MVDFIMGSVEVSLQANAHTKRLYSSTIVSIDLFSEIIDLRSGRLKCTDNRSKGCVFCIIYPGIGLKKFGFISQHASQDLHT